MVDIVASPLIQYGALGLCFVLSFIIFYLMKRFFTIIDKLEITMTDNTKIIAKNNEVMAVISMKLERFEDNHNKTLMEMAKKPCLVKESREYSNER